MAWKTNENFIKKEADENVHQMVDALQDEGGLCPNCENRFLGKVSMVSTFQKDNMIFYYTLCPKCYKKIQKGKEKDREQIKIRVEKNLMTNPLLYIAIVKHIDDIEEGENDRMISVIPDSRTNWQEDDKAFFNSHPELRFRARYIYEGELESTQKIKPNLKGDEVKKGINTAIVHKVTGEQFIRSYISDISSYPHDDENFIAALFVVLLHDISPDRIMKVYDDIKQRKEMFKDIEDLKTFY